MPRPAPKPRRNPLLPFYAILGVLALLGAYFLFRQMGGGGGTPATTLQPVVMTPEQLQRVPGISQGQPDAPVVIMEFADFQCGGCMNFATFRKPLIKDYIDNGTVRFVWYDFPLVQIHKNAVLAARAGRCANEQGQFWPMHDRIFAEQGRWSESNDAANLFIRYAGEVGLDRAAFSECLRSDKYQKEVSENYELGNTLGVNATPTLFINGKKVQEPPSTRAEWDQLIRQEAGAAPAAAPGTQPAAPAGTPPAAAPADTAAG